RASDDREKVQGDRDDDPLPAHRAESVADRGDAAVPPPYEGGERPENEEAGQRPRGAVVPQLEESLRCARSLHRAIIVGGPCAFAPRTTARSSGSPCPRSARSPPSRCTCSRTPRSS